VLQLRLFQRDLTITQFGDIETIMRYDKFGSGQCLQLLF
jgi:hypothetical protein